MTRTNNTRSGVERVLSCLLPIDCVSCKVEGDWLCQKCLNKLVTTPENICLICGRAGINGLCLNCRKQTRLDGLISVFNYSDKLVQEIIKSTKYHGHHDAAAFLVRHAKRKILARLPLDEWVFMFIPSSAARIRERGFNQSEIIARLLAAPDYKVAASLKKIVETVPQASLERRERLTNLRGAFKVVKKAVERNVVICDDVVTTSSTLKEAAKVLRRSGAKKIFGITLAHG